MRTTAWNGPETMDSSAVMKGKGKYGKGKTSPTQHQTIQVQEEKRQCKMASISSLVQVWFTWTRENNGPDNPRSMKSVTCARKEWSDDHIERSSIAEVT